MTQEMCCCCGRPVGPCAAARPALPLTTVTPHVVEYGREYLGFVAASAFICILHIHGRHCSRGKQRQAAGGAAEGGGRRWRAGAADGPPLSCIAQLCAKHTPACVMHSLLAISGVPIALGHARSPRPRIQTIASVSQFAHQTLYLPLHCSPSRCQDLSPLRFSAPGHRQLTVKLARSSQVRISEAV